METTEHSIEVRALSMGYRNRHGDWKIVHPHIDFSLSSGELTCLIGLNGAGKSTLIRTLCRFQPCISGDIFFFGRRISDYKVQEFAMTTGVVLTEKTHVGGITVYDLVSLGRHPHTGFFGRLKREDRQIVETSMEAVGIAYKARNYVSELSDGERQRAMIAKVLAQECPVIVLDEPTAFLDVASRMEIMDLLHRTAREKNKTVLMSTHDMDNALLYGDRLMLLSGQEPVLCDTPEELILNGELNRFFTGRGLDFDRETGRLSIGSDLAPVGLSGAPAVCRWMANALFRNGFRAVDPSAQHIHVACVSERSIDVVYPDGTVFHADGITSAVRNILENGPRTVPDER